MQLAPPTEFDLDQGGGAQSGPRIGIQEGSHLAERVRKVGGITLHSIGHTSRLQRVSDNEAEYVVPPDMLAELRDDNQHMSAAMRGPRGHARSCFAQCSRVTVVSCKRLPAPQPQSDRVVGYSQTWNKIR
jgi:hypothetical protein